jgi:hypothetical protein
MDRSHARSLLSAAGALSEQLTHFRNQVVEGFGRTAAVSLHADESLQEMLAIEDIAATELVNAEDKLPQGVIVATIKPDNVKLTLSSTPAEVDRG